MEKMELMRILLHILFICTAAGAKLSDLGVLQSQANVLDTDINKTLEDASERAALTKAYEDKSTECNLEKINGTVLVEELAQSLQKIFDAKVKAIQKAVDFAEKLAANYHWQKDLQLEEVKQRYVDAKLINESSPDYQYEQMFKQKVSFENSSVHIPVEIYKGDINIMNGLMWTNGLDEIWKQNRDQDPNLLWQYFGSQTGIMRNFPASKWRGEKVDLYDVRRRPWYTQGASSPKDMFILIDTSGSTHGQALALMKQAVVSMLDTLGENDFVNVGHFAADSELVVEMCFETFVQANHWNKQVLIKKVMDLEAKGMAKYDIGFEFAFEQFEKYDNVTRDDDHGQSASCNRIIMFLTDGGTDMPAGIFRKYNWNKGNKTRIFSYAVGPTANPVAAARWIACVNRGYFYKIPAMGAIRSAVQDHVTVVQRPMAAARYYYHHVSNIYADRLSDYTNIISKPMSLAPGNLFQWSDIYFDSFDYLRVISNGLYEEEAQAISLTDSYQDFGGLGMMTTVTMPVYNTVNWTKGSSNQTILGVMGSDVTVKELEQHIPQKKLGPNGYAFAINSNGYIVFHPNLKAINGYLKDPPNVDFLDVEYASLDPEEKELLRRRMIDQDSGKMPIKGFVVVEDEMHIDTKDRIYYYTGIANSSFSVAIVLPDYTKQYCNLVNAGIKTTAGIESLRGDSSAIFLAPWEYCPNVTVPENITWQSSLEELTNVIQGNIDSCKKEMIQHLFFDAIVTKSMVTKWKDSIKPGIETVFAATDSGLTRVFSPSLDDSVERFNSIRDVWDEVYYRRSMDNSKLWMFLPTYGSISNASDVMDENATAPLITATKAISLPTRKPAVIGVQMNQAFLRDKITEHVGDCKKRDIICYLLDDAGFLVVSTDTNLENDVGKPFEEIEPVLMNTILNKDTLIKHEHYDYQGVCVPQKETVSAGFRSVVPPAVFELLTVKWWTTKVVWAYLNFNIYNWVTSLFGGTSNQVLASEEDSLYRNNSCIKLGAQYYRSDKTFKDLAKCGNCTREMFAAKLERSNLMLVIAKDIHTCKDSYCDTRSRDIPRQYEEPRDPEFILKHNCNVTRRYRKRPDHCYDYNPNEDNDCGSGSVINVNIYLVVMTTTMAAIITSMTTTTTTMIR